jgi:hypothetical protein
MLHLTKKGLLAFVLSTLAGPVLAGAGSISVTVTPLSSQVTYSTNAITSPARPALLTTVGYTVQIANAGGNTINDIRFTGSVSATDASEVATLTSVDGATCTTIGTTLSCSITQLKAGQVAPTFAVFFSAPVRNPVAPLPNGVLDACDTTDCLKFSGVLFYAEQTNGGNPAPNSVFTWTPAFAALGTPSFTNVRSAVPKSGGSYFTGDGGITTPTDPFTASVVVPAGTTYTTADITESTTTVISDSNCVNFTVCQKAQITVPGTFSPYLQIVLRLDSSFIPHGLNINSINLHYEGSPTPLGLCASPTTPNGGANAGIPCIAKKVYYKNRSVPGWTPDLDGDFEWTLLNIKNGGYAID